MNELKLPAGLALGGIAAVAVHGLVNLVSITERDGQHYLEARTRTAGMKLFIPYDQIKNVLRVLVDAERAARLLAELRAVVPQSDDRGARTRRLDYTKTLLDRPFEHVVDRLGKLYASPYKPSFGDLKLVLAYEDVVLPELAHALGLTAEALSAEMRAKQPVFRATSPRPVEPEEPPAPIVGPALTGHELLGALEIGAQLVVGEHVYGDLDRKGAACVIAVRPGRFYAYVSRDAQGSKAIVIHEEAIERARAGLPQLAEIGEVFVHGGHVTFCDAAARNDEAIGDELRYLPDTRVVLGRACMINTGGDGAFPVRVFARQGLIEAASVEF